MHNTCLIKAANSPARSAEQVNSKEKGLSLPAVPVLQNKPVQKMAAEEEEPLQGNFLVQRQANSTLDGKGAAQLKSAEKEELPLQRKFTMQKKEFEEEVPLQGKFISAETAQEQQNTVQRFIPETPTLQKKENNTGLPDNLKEGVESLSGIALDDVRVHYNSDKPAQLNALAYAQGTDIHVGSGQEKHLPHEAWHVVQQKQGRVQPTIQMKEGVAVNDNRGLEKEADVMGSRASKLDTDYIPVLVQKQTKGEIIQPYMEFLVPIAEYLGVEAQIAIVAAALGISPGVLVGMWMGAGSLLAGWSVVKVINWLKNGQSGQKEAPEEEKAEKKDQILVKEQQIMEVQQPVDKENSTEGLTTKIEEKSSTETQVLEVDSDPSKITSETGTKEEEVLKNFPAESQIDKPENEKQDEVKEAKQDLKLMLEPDSEIQVANEPIYINVPLKNGKQKNGRPRRNQKVKKRSESNYVQTEEVVETAPQKNNGFQPRQKQMKDAVKRTQKEEDDLIVLANWVSDERMWSALTTDSITASTGIDLANSRMIEDFKVWIQKEGTTDFHEAAKTMLMFQKLQSNATEQKASKDVKHTQKNTLSQVEKYWNTGKQEVGNGIIKGTLSVGTSKSGGGMLLLKGIKVLVNEKLEEAHISLPSSQEGDGTFSEGHLKIEGGSLLNQYFFAIDATGKVSKLTNSPTVPTANPGQWNRLSAAVWSSVKDSVEKLATGDLSGK